MVRQGGSVTTGPNHGAFAVKYLAQFLLREGYSEAQIFEGTGVAPDVLTRDHPVLPFREIAQFFENASHLTQNDILGHQRGQKRDFRKAGLISYVGMSSPTIRDALGNMIRYMRVFSDAVELDPSELQRTGKLVWRYVVPHDVNRRQFVEFGASGLIHDLRLAANRDFSPRCVSFRHARRTNLDAFGSFFKSEVRFADAENAVHFAPKDLDLPLLTADNDLHLVLQDHCEMVLRDKSRNVPSLILDVERAIAAHLTVGRATHVHVASSLGMSARTLSRRLAEEGTSFKAALNSLRASLAKSYLKDSDLTLAEISYLLGYSQSGAFNDAFRRWTGKTPGQFRSH